MANESKKKTATRVYINRGGNIVFERGGRAVAFTPEEMEKIQSSLPVLIEQGKNVKQQPAAVVLTGEE